MTLQGRPISAIARAGRRLAGETGADRLADMALRRDAFFGLPAGIAVILALPAGVALGAAAIGLLDDRGATGREKPQVATTAAAPAGHTETPVQEPGPKSAGAQPRVEDN